MKCNQRRRKIIPQLQLLRFNTPTMNLEIQHISSLTHMQKLSHAHICNKTYIAMNEKTRIGNILFCFNVDFFSKHGTAEVKR